MNLDAVFSELMQAIDRLETYSDERDRLKSAINTVNANYTLMELKVKNLEMVVSDLRTQLMNQGLSSDGQTV